MSGHKRLFKVLAFTLCAVTLLSFLGVSIFAANRAGGAFGIPQTSGVLLFLSSLLAIPFSADDGVFFAFVVASVAVLVLLFIIMRQFLKKK